MTTFMIALHFYNEYVLVLLWLMNADLITVLKWEWAVANEDDGLEFNYQNVNISLNISRAYLIIFMIAPFFMVNMS